MIINITKRIVVTIRYTVTILSATHSHTDMDQKSTELTKWLQAYMEEDDEVEPDIEGLQSGLSSKHRLKILTERYEGTSLFHKAIQLNHDTIVKLLLKTLPPGDIITN